MAKGAYLTPRIKGLLAKIYIENRGIRPTDARKGLLQKMKNEDLDKIFGPDFPSVSSVSKLLKEYRERDKARSPELKKLDRPWTFGSLAEYPIPTEAVPLVISIYEKCLLEGSEEWFPSIREVLWIGRLYKIVEFYHSKHILPLPDPEAEALRLKLGHRPEGYQKIKLEDIVLDWAFVYAKDEELSEIEGEPFDSRELDVYLTANVFEYYGERRRSFIEYIAEQYGVDANKLEALDLPLGVIEQFAERLFKSQVKFRYFLIPKEDEEIREELRKLEVVSFSGDLVTLGAKKGFSDALLRKLEKYEVNIKEEAENERTHNQEG